MIDTEQLWARKTDLQDELEDIERKEKKICDMLRPRVAKAMGSVYPMGFYMSGVVFKIVTMVEGKWRDEFMTIPHGEVHNDWPPKKEIGQGDKRAKEWGRVGLSGTDLPRQAPSRAVVRFNYQVRIIYHK